MWFDLSPMRPDEFGKQTAATWERAEQIQAAFEAGKTIERMARNRAVETKRKQSESLERLKQKV